MCWAAQSESRNDSEHRLAERGQLAASVYPVCAPLLSPQILQAL